MIQVFPFYKQIDQVDCGPACLKMIAKFYGKRIELNDLNNETNLTKQGVSLKDILDASESMGFNSKVIKCSLDSLLRDVTLPCIVPWRETHFVVVYKVSKRKVYIADPAHGLLKYSKKEFIFGWIKDNVNLSEKGFVLMLQPTSYFFEKKIDNYSKNYGSKFLTRYFKPYKSYLIQLFFGLILGSLLQLIFPFLTQSVVDYGINYQNINFVYLILIAQLTLFTSQTSVELIRSWLLLHMTSRININLVSDFLIKLMKLPISFFDSKNTGDIVQRIYDHNRIQRFLSSTTLNTLFSAFNIVIFGYVLAYYSIVIFFVFFLGSFIYILWTLFFMKKRAVIDYKRFNSSSANQSSIFQLISGMQEIKLNGSEKRRRWEWEEIQVKLFKISIKGLKLNQIQNTGARFFNELKNIIITFIAAKSVINGELTLGMMLSVQYIVGQLNLPINNFITFFQMGQDAKLSLERLKEVHLKKNEETDEDISEIEYSGINIKNVSFKYRDSSVFALKEINLLIPKGKVTAIVGESGSGKTTLLKLLLKFYKPNNGNIKIGNHNLKSINAKKWRELCGVVMQNGFIFSDSIIRNVTESDSESLFDEKKFDEAIKIANLKEFVRDLRLGVDTKIGSSGVNISGGQKQRVLIARAVYKDPNYIFFDEATSSLDSNNEKKIMRNLKKFYRGKTVLVVAHRLSTVKNADQIVVMDKGEIVEIGTHDSLIQKKGKYYSLIKNQLELGS
ncbi:MAG: peptidase domain-containing ABC transporter [Flavobacteriaceae bacterium]|nr:peptidase domain-containing ABC transporter [Flavobacteriaceae bacterium]